MLKEILSLAAIVIGVTLGTFIHVIIHESGHLIFGLLTGYKFSLFRIFGFVWIKDMLD